MANGQGGARIGAGRKKKALAGNLADGNPGKRKLTVLDFTDSAADLEGQTMPPPRAFLAAKQKNGKDLLAMEVYEETWKWLAERNCAQLIPAQILEQYAMAISRWIQCEECITEYGFLAKHPTTGNAIPSPYVAMSQSFSKQANNLWYQIYQVVRENCAVEYRGATPHDDMIRARWLPWMTSARCTSTGTTAPASEPPMARTSSAAYKQRVLRPRAGLPARPLAAKISLKKEPW